VPYKARIVTVETPCASSVLEEELRLHIEHAA